MRVEVHAALLRVLPQKAQVLARSHPSQIPESELVPGHKNEVHARHLPPRAAEDAK